MLSVPCFTCASLQSRRPVEGNVQGTKRPLRMGNETYWERKVHKPPLWTLKYEPYNFFEDDYEVWQITGQWSGRASTGVNGDLVCRNHERVRGHKVWSRNSSCRRQLKIFQCRNSVKKSILHQGHTTCTWTLIGRNLVVVVNSWWPINSSSFFFCRQLSRFDGNVTMTIREDRGQRTEGGVTESFAACMTSSRMSARLKRLEALDVCLSGRSLGELTSTEMLLVLGWFYHKKWLHENQRRLQQKFRDEWPTVLCSDSSTG